MCSVLASSAAFGACRYPVGVAPFEELLFALDDLRITHGRIAIQALKPELVVQGAADDLEDGLLRGFHCGPGVSHNLGCDVLGRGHQVALGHNAIDQMYFFGTFRVDGFTHQLQLHRDAHPDRVDQPDDAPVGEMHAPAHVEEAEVRVFGGDPDVAGQGQLDAAPDDPAVERRDDRFGDAM